MLFKETEKYLDASHLEIWNLSFIIKGPGIWNMVKRWVTQIGSLMTNMWNIWDKNTVHTD